MYRYSNEYRRLCIAATFALAVSTLTLGEADAHGIVGQSVALLAAPVPRLAVSDSGRAAPQTRIDIALALNYRNPAELEALVAAAANAGSPEYGHFLTPAQFTAGFAPTVTQYERVASTLVHAGFTVTRLSPTRTVINASAPAAVVERFFHTEIHAVKQRAGNALRSGYANGTPAAIPAALRDIAFGVAGLNNLVVAKTQNVRAGTRRVDLALGYPLQGPDTGLGPFAFASAYDFPVQHGRPGAPGATFDGTGHSAAVAIDSDFVNSDISSFFDYFKIKRTAPIMRVSVNGGSTINFDGIETVLDVETIASVSPGAGVYVYLMPSLSTPNIVDTYAKVVEDDKVDVVNSSFGGCETDDNLGVLSDHIALQGAAEGITFAASSGDFGAQTCLFSTASGLGVSAPASGPHFTAVGGTSLLISPAAKYLRELAWIGSGGGVSAVFGLPSYQHGIANVITSGRNVPDVAFDANPGTGTSLYYTGAFVGPIGGTSLSSPLFSALMTQYNETTGRRSGAINGVLYAYFKKTGYGARFRDISLGNNSYFGPGYNALSGYDDVTGLGSLIGTLYAK